MREANRSKLRVRLRGAIRAEHVSLARYNVSERPLDRDLDGSPPEIDQLVATRSMLIKFYDTSLQTHNSATSIFIISRVVVQLCTYLVNLYRY